MLGSRPEQPIAEPELIPLPNTTGVVLEKLGTKILVRVPKVKQPEAGPILDCA